MNTISKRRVVRSLLLSAILLLSASSGSAQGDDPTFRGGKVEPRAASVDEIALGSSAPSLNSHRPLSFAATLATLPDRVQINTRRNAGSHLITGLEAIEITDLNISVDGFAPATYTTQSLNQDPTNDSPYDNLNDGTTFFVIMDVPVDAVRLVAEITASEAIDIDLFVGSGETPSAATEVCSSASGLVLEYCNIDDPAAGSWWILVQNWQASGSAPDDVTLATAALTHGTNGNMNVTGPVSIPAATPFDVRVLWDEPTLSQGDHLYGSFSMGSDAANPGNIGRINVDLIRHEDDVTKTVSSSTAERGDTLSYTITVQPNVTDIDQTYSITDTIPPGMTYVAGSATNGAIVTDNILTWTATLPTTLDASGQYVMTTNDSDPLCGVSGYINLEDFDIFTDAVIVGDTVGFTAFSSGAPFNYFGEEYTGMSFTDDGFVIFDFASNYGGLPWIPQTLPDVALPNNVLAILWNDLQIFYDAALNHGVSLATIGPNLVIIEYDNAQLFGGSADTWDFEIIMSRTVDDTPGVYEIVYAYDNLGSLTGPLTVGVENADGTQSVTLVNNEDASATLNNGLMVCFDFTGASFTPEQITYQVTVDDDASGTLTNQVIHSVDNPGSLASSTSVDVTIAVQTLFVSSHTAGVVDGIAFDDEDILAYDVNTGTWSMFFDGSDLGLIERADINAFYIEDDGSILMSFDRSVHFADLGWRKDEDIVRFIPISLGENTAGSFEMFFDGSDVDLGSFGEEVDAIGFTPEGNLVVSTRHHFEVEGLSGTDEDLIEFLDISFGNTTQGTWSLYFDGSDVGLSGWSKDIWGTWIDEITGNIYLTTFRSFSVNGISGDGVDIFICAPTTLGEQTQCTFSSFFDGSASGFPEDNTFDAMHIQ